MNGSLARIVRLLSRSFGWVPRDVPGVMWLAEFFCETPGSWLFRGPTTTWLSDGALTAQLPRSYRIFARYCSWQNGDLVGAELLLRFIIWVRRIAGRESAIRLDVGGKTVFVDLSDPRFLTIPHELTDGLPIVLKRFLSPGDTFVDVGSNHGTFAISAAELVGPEGLVIAIEPQARLAELIRRSLELCGVPFIVHNVACGDAEGHASLYVPCASSGASSLHRAYSGVCRHRMATVPITRLDDLVSPGRLPGRVFMKLDIEGNEVRCLTGAREFLAQSRPVILLEVNSIALEAAGHSVAELIALLRDAGYDRYLGGPDCDEERVLTDRIADSNIVAIPCLADAPCEP